MSYSDWRLAAELLPSDPITKYYLVSLDPLPPGRYAIYRKLLPGEILPDLWLGPFYIPGGRFPYGYDVEPDQP